MTKKQALHSLGMRIKAARKNHSITQEELATQINVNTITVSRWETGKQSPAYPTLCKIAETFDMPVSLLTDNPDYSSDVPNDFLYIISGGMKKKSNVTAKFENMIRDIGCLNPDVLVMICEIEQVWDTLERGEKQVISDGFAFLLGHFKILLSEKH